MISFREGLQSYALTLTLPVEAFIRLANEQASHREEVKHNLVFYVATEEP